MSRYGLVGMALVVALFTVILLIVAPRPGLGPARRMSLLGNAIDLYTIRHDGRLPTDLRELADEHLLGADLVTLLSAQVKYLAAGRTRDALGGHGIVAVEDPSGVAGSILVHVLLADGAVLAMPADVVREAAARGAAGPVARVDSAPDGQLTVVSASGAD